MSHWLVLFPVYWQLLSSRVLKASRTQSLLNYATRYGTAINSPGEQQLVNEFEKDNPGIKVEIELTPYDQYFIKLSSAVGGNVAPDVFWMNMPNFQQYVKKWHAGTTE